MLTVCGFNFVIIHDEQSKLLMSAPGVGRTTAMLFLLEIGDIKRFGPFDKLMIL